MRTVLKWSVGVLRGLDVEEGNVRTWVVGLCLALLVAAGGAYPTSAWAEGLVGPTGQLEATPQGLERILIQKTELLGLLLDGDIKGAQERLMSYTRESLETWLTVGVKPHLKGVDYTVGWEGGWPQIRVNLPPGDPLVLNVPVDAVERFVVWHMLAGVPNKVWVAEGSTPEKARWAWRTARLRLDRPIVVLLSCPSDHYEREDVRKAWDAKVEELRSLGAKTGIPIEVVDLSAWPAEDAVAEVQARLLSEGAQVLGFFHRADINSFEVGQRGFLTKKEIEEVAAHAPPVERFVAILGCNPLFFGLNDVFVSSGLVPFTLTVGKTIIAPEMFEYLEELFAFLAGEWGQGRIEVPASEIQEKSEKVDIQLKGRIEPAVGC